MKKLAMIVTRGGYTNLWQACELVRIAATNGAQVSVLFRDEAAGRLTAERLKDLSLSEAYRGREGRVRELLQEHQQHDLAAWLRQIKETGDVTLSVCRDSLPLFDLRVEQLIPELDEVQKLDAFWKEDVLSADQVLTF